jgi:Methyltransferase domain
MMRWDIINHLIRRYNYKSYLEIGYAQGWSFDRVDIEQNMKAATTIKLAVDPRPWKYEWQESLPRGTVYFGLDGKDSQVLVKMTSDEFFSRIDKDIKFDVVFIDGLHKTDQVDRDLWNSLKHLNVNGTIVLHDCNPPTEEHVTTGTLSWEWNGDVYKSILKLHQDPNVEFYVVDTDWGCGIVKRHSGRTIHDKRMAPVEAYNNWHYFDTNRKELLNLITVEDFLMALLREY